MWNGLIRVRRVKHLTESGAIMETVQAYLNEDDEDDCQDIRCSHKQMIKGRMMWLDTIELHVTCDLFEWVIPCCRSITFFIDTLPVLLQTNNWMEDCRLLISMGRFTVTLPWIWEGRGRSWVFRLNVRSTGIIKSEMFQINTEEPPVLKEEFTWQRR